MIKSSYRPLGFVVSAALVTVSVSPAFADDTLAIGGWAFRVNAKDIPGGDFLATQSSDVRTCALYCANDGRCQAFAFVENVPLGSRPNCWLKSAVMGSSPVAGVQSGVRMARAPIAPPPCGSVRMTDERGVARGVAKKALQRIPMEPGDVFKYSIAPAIAAGDRQTTACALRCNDTPGCVASTYYQPGAIEARAVCELHAYVGTFRPDSRAHSAVRLAPAYCP